MTKQETITNFIANLASEYQNAYVIANNVIMSVPKFYTYVLPGYCSDNVKVEDIVKYTKTNIKFYTYTEVLVKYVNNIVSLDKDLNDEDLNELVTRITKLSSHGFFMPYGENEISVGEYIAKYKNNKLAQIEESKIDVNSLQSKVESCKMYLDRLLEVYGDTALTDIIIPGRNQTLADIVLNVFPFHMKDYNHIELAGTTYDIEFAINYMVNAAFEEKKHLTETALINYNEYNHVNDTPGNVPELIVDENKQVTGSIPIVNPDLTLNEINAIKLTNSTNVDEALSNLMQSLKNVNSKETLDVLISDFNSLKDKSSNTDLVNAVNALIEEASKRVIISNANKEDLADTIMGDLNNNTPKTDYELMKIEQSLVENDIDDHSINDSLDKEKAARVEEHIVAANLPINNEAVLASANIDNILFDIKRLRNDYLILKDVDTARAAGVEVQLKNREDEFYRTLESANISEETKQQYYAMISEKDINRVK